MQMLLLALHYEMTFPTPTTSSSAATTSLAVAKEKQGNIVKIRLICHLFYFLIFHYHKKS